MTPADTIQVFVNERPHRVARGTSLRALRDALRPAADVVILNGFPVPDDPALRADDRVVLIQRGVVPPADELEAQMVARHGPGVHQAVRRARVGIAGCGGLGSAVAVSLARLGVGFLRLVDFDLVEPSNLNRQQFFVDQLGQAKVAALSANLVRINPWVKLETLREHVTGDNARALFAGCDVVAECFDDPAAKRDLLVGLRRDLPRLPLVTVSGIAGYGPSQEITIRRAMGNVWVVGDGSSDARPGRGLLAPRVAVAAGHQANLILRILLGEEEMNDARHDQR